MGAVNQVVSSVSSGLTNILQPVEKAVSQTITNVGKSISNSPALEGAITAIGAAYGVPPAATAAFLAANKTSQTGGNLEKGLETLVLSYGAGKLMPVKGIDLSSPAAIDQSVAQAQTAAQAAAPAASNVAGGSGSALAGLGGSPFAPAVSAAGSAPGYVSAGTSLGSMLSGLGGSPVAPAASAAGSTPGYISSLTDTLNSGASGLTGLLGQAGNAIGNVIGGLSGTQLGALGTGAAGLYNASATREAMQQAIGATQAANAASQGTLGNIYNQQLGYQAPYQAAGVGAVNQLAGMNPYLTHQFNAADLQAGLAPNYDFMLQQGQQANQRAANVGGGALGGNALTGLNQYTQNYAGNAYQNAFNNYQSQRQNIYSDLAGIAGIGQTANTGAGTAGTNYGQGITGLNTSLANAQSANILGQAQVGAGGVTNAANTAFLATLLGQNTPTAGTTPTSGGTSISDFAKLLTGIKAFTG